MRDGLGRSRISMTASGKVGPHPTLSRKQERAIRLSPWIGRQNMSQTVAPSTSRYIRQEILGQFGADGQERLHQAHVGLVGAGALGSTIADLLVRAGLGKLTLVDRDYVELHN